MEFSAQVNAMQHLKEQLEQRTRMIQANIQRQQEELRHIQEQLQRVQGQGIQVWWEIYCNESAFSYSTDLKSPVIQVGFRWDSGGIPFHKPRLQYLNMLYPI